MTGNSNVCNEIYGYMFLIFFISTNFFSVSGCTENEPIPIGFAAQLTGKQAELGVQERNGVQMAVEKVNASGGIGGRRIELIIRDDLGTPEGAVIADRELIASDVVMIIGHATSSQTIAALPEVNAARIVMLSPTTSTHELSGKDDYLFRLPQTTFDRSQVLARHIRQSRGLSKLAVIYDTHNAAYTKAFLNAFVEKYQAVGGEIVGSAPYSSMGNPDFHSLINKLSQSGAQGLLIITSDADAADIAQKTRIQGWQAPLFTTSWAQTEILIKNGGQAVEGMEYETAYSSTSRSPVFLDFKTHYQARFGREPSFGAMLGFESVLVASAALKKTGGKAEGLRQALLETRYEGLLDSLSFDKYGDVIRPFYLGVIRNGKFVDIKRMNVDKY